MRRHADWLAQAERNLQMARTLFEGKIFEGACFHCQQAAELAVKALLESSGRRATGHDVRELLELSGVTDQELMEQAGTLDRYYIGPRYPNAFSAGAPKDHYYQRDTVEAIRFAETILGFVKEQIAGL
jgi:HEPN domain-containing protein